MSLDALRDGEVFLKSNLFGCNARPGAELGSRMSVTLFALSLYNPVAPQDSWIALLNDKPNPPNKTGREKKLAEESFLGRKCNGEERT